MLVYPMCVYLHLRIFVQCISVLTGEPSISWSRWYVWLWLVAWHIWGTWGWIPSQPGSEQWDHHHHHHHHHPRRRRRRHHHHPRRRRHHHHHHHHAWRCKKLLQTPDENCATLRIFQALQGFEGWGQSRTWQNVHMARRWTPVKMDCRNLTRLGDFHLANPCHFVPWWMCIKSSL